ncbi:ABC transporter permease subunit (plasmid) [Arthrobacter sp. D3-18]
MNALRKVVFGGLIPVAVIAGYSVLTTTSRNPYFPNPARIMNRFQKLWLFDKVPTDVIPSLTNFILGYVIAVVSGVVAGVVLGRIKLLRLLFAPLLDFARSIPPIMLIPPFVLLLGIGDESKVAIIALGAFFPVVLATMDGLRRTDPALIDVTRSLQLSRWRELLVAWIPSAGPQIAGGMQTGLQFAFILMVASEMLAATHGLGYLTMQAQVTFDSASVWTGILMLAILGFGLNTLFVLARNRILRWHVQSRAAARAR